MTSTAAVADLPCARTILSIATFVTAAPDEEPLAPGALRFLVVTAESASARLADLAASSSAAGDFNAPTVARDGAALLRARAAKLREML